MVDEPGTESAPAASDGSSTADGRETAALTARLAAVERALTDGAAPVADLEDAAEFHERLDDLEASLTAATERLDELEAQVEALRGFAGGISAVNEDVERRADAALAAVESLEDALRDDPGLRVERLDGTAGERADGAAGERADGAVGETVDGGTAERTTRVSSGDDAETRSLTERVRDAL